jgi:phage shock protein PspC (stress-responsive transcriptional regulator)
MRLRPDRLFLSPTVIRFIYAICMAGATVNHARILLEYGIGWNYGGVHPFYATFWTSLAFFDALAVLLLLVRPRAGLALTALIIVSDVVINASAGILHAFDWAAFAVQFLFMVFVLATVCRAWRDHEPVTTAIA